MRTVLTSNGYTLVDALVQLMMVLLFSNLLFFFFVWLHDSEKHLLKTDEIEFELFSQEFATYLINVQNIELQSNGSGIRILQIDYEYDIEFTGSLIRKQKNRLGHEPMLLHMTHSQFEVNDSKLKLNVEFESGLQKERVYEISFVP